MHLAGFSQVEMADISPGALDVVIAACGYEERAPYVAGLLGPNPRVRLALRFVEHARHDVRDSNERAFEGLGYEQVDCSGDDARAAGTALAVRLPTARAGQALRIGIDISSMTRAWCWGLAKRVSELNTAFDVEVYFFYAAAEYTPPVSSTAPPRSLGPIPGLGGSLELPDRDIALLIGLGYETDRALGVVEYIEPRSTWLFYADPAVDPTFINEVKRANSALLDRVGPENVVPYRLHDLGHTLAMLDSLVGRLVVNSRVIIVPMGPKPFALLAFLLGLRYPEVDVWRVSAGAGAEPQRRRPSGTVLVGRASFAPTTQPKSGQP
jgi:hypothetical protein